MAPAGGALERRPRFCARKSRAEARQPARANAAALLGAAVFVGFATEQAPEGTRYLPASSHRGGRTVVVAKIDGFACHGHGHGHETQLFGVHAPKNGRPTREA